MKKIFSFLIIITLIALAVPAFAVWDGNYIIDNAGYFYEDELSNLNQKADAIRNETGYNVMFSITDNTGDLSLYEYIEDQYNNSSGAEDGVILGYNTEKNTWSAYLSGNAVNIFTEDDEQKLWDAVEDNETVTDGVYDYLELAKSYLPVYANATTETGVRLVDNAGLLTQSEREKIKSKLDEISERQNCDVVVVTANTLNGKSPMVYADDFQDYNGYSDNGILLLVSMEDRDWYISTKGSGIEAVTDAGWQYIGDEIVSYLSDGDYYGAFSKYADLCDDFLTHKEETGEPYDSGSLPKKPLSPMWYLYSLIGGAVSALFKTKSMKSDLKSVQFNNSAGNYVKSNSLNVTESKDIFLYTHIDRQRKPEPSRSGSTSTHTSSSGSTHGGGGGKF